MSGWRLVIGIVLIVHGVGHILGVLALTPLGGEHWNGRSWLLTDALGDGAAKAFSLVLWIGTFAAFIIGGLALLEVGFPESWWRPVTVAAAVVSLTALALYWNAFPALVPNKVGAIAVNLVALWGVLVGDWPSEQMLAGTIVVGALRSAPGTREDVP